MRSTAADRRSPVHAVVCGDGTRDAAEECDDGNSTNMQRSVRAFFHDVYQDSLAAQLLVSIIQYMGLTDINTVGVTKVTGPLRILYA